MSFALTAFYILTAATGATLAHRGHHPRRLKTLRIYLTFAAVATAAGSLAMLTGSPQSYRSAFWTIEILHDLILCAVALEVITVMLPQRVVMCLSLFLSIVLVLTIRRDLSGNGTGGLINIAMTADFTAGLLLAPLVFFDSLTWEREKALAAIGVCITLAADVIPATVHAITGTSADLSAITEAGSIIGMVLLAAAAASGRPENAPSTRLP